MDIFSGFIEFKPKDNKLLRKKMRLYFSNMVYLVPLMMVYLMMRRELHYLCLLKEAMMSGLETLEAILILNYIKLLIPKRLHSGNFPYNKWLFMISLLFYPM
jgi:hypothetical protein